MDFYARAKDELVRTMPERQCCKAAELCGLVKTDGVARITEGRVSLSIPESSAAVARKILALLKDVTRPEVQVAVAKGGGVPRGNAYIVRLPGHEDAMNLLQRLGLADLHSGGGPESDVLESYCCKRAFIRGAFLGAGYMSQPGKGYHLEIYVESEAFAHFLAELMTEFGVRAGIVERRGRHVVYVKDGDGVVELLRVMEAPNALLEMENDRVLRSIRNDVNRLVNAENANVAKTVDASCRQVQDIQLIDDYIGLRRLPASLRQIAQARLDNPEASLTQLGQMLSPEITKSGVNHRMRRLASLAESLRRKGGHA